MPYFGGKQRIASSIAAMFPRTVTTSSRTPAAPSVLLAKTPAPLETVNDLTALRVAGYLRQTTDPAWITTALEHLLRALRTTSVQEEPDAD